MDSRPMHPVAYLVLIVLILVSALPLQGGETCWEGALVAGALPEQPGPVFCSIDSAGPGTAVEGESVWLDRFEHGLSFADFDGAGYAVFDAVDGIFDSIHWRHANHWMVDVAPVPPGSADETVGGSLMRPEATFRFEDGRLILEAVMAAGHHDYDGGKAWGEIVVSTGSEPTGYRQGGALYGYDMFPFHYTLGCRLQPERVPICALMDDSDQSALGGGRLWEMSFFQPVGETNFGGYPGVTDPPVWNRCEEDMPDGVCRDRFRMELTQTSLTLYVNEVKYFEQTGIPALPPELLKQELYVYMGSMVGRSDYEVVRFHWDDIAVKRPSAIFSDGFEDGTTGAWDGAVE